MTPAFPEGDAPKTRTLPRCLVSLARLRSTVPRSDHWHPRSLQDAPSGSRRESLVRERHDAVGKGQEQTPTEVGAGDACKSFGFRSVHVRSTRTSGYVVEVVCGQLPDSLRVEVRGSPEAERRRHAANLPTSGMDWRLPFPGGFRCRAHVEDRMSRRCPRGKNVIRRVSILGPSLHRQPRYRRARDSRGLDGQCEGRARPKRLLRGAARHVSGDQASAAHA